jgi:hypothetical protein
VAAASLTLFEPARTGAALVFGLAVVDAAFVIPAAAAEVRTAVTLADCFASRFATPSAAAFPTARRSEEATPTTSRAGSIGSALEPASFAPLRPTRAAFAFPPVVFAIAIRFAPAAAALESNAFAATSPQKGFTPPSAAPVNA